MKKETFNVTKHPSYEKYTEIRDVRNDSAKEILSNYPLHREFVNRFAKEFFISKKSMESQVAYAERTSGFSKPDEKAAAQSSKSEADALKQLLQSFTREANPSHKTEQYGDNISKWHDSVRSEQNDSMYNLARNIYQRDHVYGLHVSTNMLCEYCFANSLNMSMKDYVNEYAGMLIQHKTDSADVKGASAELIESGIRQALCFEAIKKAEGITVLSSESTRELHAKASALADYVTNENIHITYSRK